MNAETGPTADDIVRRYIELRDYVKARTDEMEKTGATERDKGMIRSMREAVEEIMKTPGGFQFWTDLMNEAADRLEQLLTPLAEFKSSMKTLEGAADLLMKQTGQKALSTEHGTAFYKQGSSVTCKDAQAFLDFVFKHNARQFLTAHVSKEAVENYMEGPGAGHPPPGVSVESFIQVQFRKA